MLGSRPSKSLELSSSEGTSDNAMALDLYVNAKASNAGISVEGIETYAFQGKIFDDLSDEYQENYLAMTGRQQPPDTARC